jgi:nitronate monooxygenase
MTQQPGRAGARTTLTTLVPCRHPLQLAPMGAAVTPALAAAVSSAGGLGMIPGRAAGQVEAWIEEVRSIGAGPVGVGILAQWADPGVVEIAARIADVVDFFWGQPSADLVRAARAQGAVVGWQVGSVDEAVDAARVGCDFVTVQGCEAGGHVRGVTPLRQLLAATLARVDLPVLAAGGIGTARDVADVLASGAGGMRIGTRFLAATEADVHPRYLAALIDAREGDTCVTETFAVGWPDAPHRVLCSAIRAAEAEASVTVGTHDGHPIPRFSSMPPRRLTTGAIEAMALYAGTSVSAVVRAQPASDIVRELMSQT